MSGHLKRKVPPGACAFCRCEFGEYDQLRELVKCVRCRNVWPSSYWREQR